MKDWLVTTLEIYRSSFVRGGTVAAANWPVLGSVFAYAVLKLFTGRAREVHAAVWIVAALFVVRFALA